MIKKNLIIEKPVIIIAVYDRYNHIRKCLESLEEAEGSESYHVIIGSDASANIKHSCKVDKVREYLVEKEKNHIFKALSVIYHDVNVGERENSIRCHALAKLYKYQSFIAMEDDVVVGKYFLDFMSEGLKKFVDCDDVIAVNGYLDPTLNVNGSGPFLYNRFSAYGFASWYEKWEPVQKRRVSINYASKLLSNINLFKRLARLTPNAKSYPFLAERFYKAGDLEVGLMMELEELWVLRPHISLTANRGMDGSGLRSGVNTVLQAMEPYNGKVEVPDSSSIKRLKFDEVKEAIDIRYIAQNWVSFIFYRYIPFGFEILKRLRLVKKSL